MNLKPEELVKALLYCGNGGDCDACCHPCHGEHGEFEWRCLGPLLLHAASQIERDQKELAALREKVPQWISVSEKMPTDHLKRYLISFKDAGGGIVDMARYIHGLGWECNNWEVPQELITHWMPLPEPPKEV